MIRLPKRHCVGVFQNRLSACSWAVSWQNKCHGLPQALHRVFRSLVRDLVAQSLDNDLREEVYQPIEKWHLRYREVKVRSHTFPSLCTTRDLPQTFRRLLLHCGLDCSASSLGTFAGTLMPPCTGPHQRGRDGASGVRQISPEARGGAQARPEGCRQERRQAGRWHRERRVHPPGGGRADMCAVVASLSASAVQPALSVPVTQIVGLFLCCTSLIRIVKHNMV